MIRTFPERMSAEEIVYRIAESFVLYVGIRKRPSGPGQVVMECDEETRKKLQSLKSDDLANVRPDIGALFGCCWDYKDTWEANVGRAPRRMSDEERTALLLKFDREMLL